MSVWIVEGGEYDDRHIDSVWSREDLARAAADRYDRAHGLWSNGSRVEFPHRYRDDPTHSCRETCRCIADGATANEWSVIE